MGLFWSAKKQPQQDQVDQKLVEVGDIPEGGFLDALKHLVDECQKAASHISEVNCLRTAIQDIKALLAEQVSSQLRNSCATIEDCISKIVEILLSVVKRINFSTQDCILHMEHDDATESSLQNMLGYDRTSDLLKNLSKKVDDLSTACSKLKVQLENIASLGYPTQQEKEDGVLLLKALGMVYLL
jgi:hypothetical protein